MGLGSSRRLGLGSSRRLGLGSSRRSGLGSRRSLGLGSSRRCITRRLRPRLPQRKTARLSRPAQTARPPEMTARMIIWMGRTWPLREPPCASKSIASTIASVSAWTGFGFRFGLGFGSGFDQGVSQCRTPVRSEASLSMHSGRARTCPGAMQRTMFQKIWPICGSVSEATSTSWG